jgi:REP element-mobilizing transposase RayT
MKRTHNYKQQEFFPKSKSEHGGSLMNARKRRRPLSVKHTMHLVLRSTQARSGWSLKRHQKSIDQILKKFANKYSIDIINYANVGNHLHLHVKLRTRDSYKPFIRAITAAIVMAVTGFSKWRPKPKHLKFWDQRPFTRIAANLREFLNLKKYVLLNIEEGNGLSRKQAKQRTSRLQLKIQSG